MYSLKPPEALLDEQAVSNAIRVFLAYTREELQDFGGLATEVLVAASEMPSAQRSKLLQRFVQEHVEGRATSEDMLGVVLSALQEADDGQK